MKPRYKSNIFLPLIWVAAFAFYFPSLRAQYVFDDLWFIVSNSSIRTFTPAKYFTDNTTVANPASGLTKDVYRPLTTLSFAVDYQLWKLDSSIVHLENILLHGFNGLLVLFLLRSILKSDLAAWVGCFVFLLHPIQIQAVSWASQRSALLGTAGVLGSLNMIVREGTRVSGRVGLAFLFFLLALFSKEIAIVTPLLIVLLDGMVGHWKFSGRNAKERFFFYSGWAGMTVIYLFVRGAFLPFSQFGATRLFAWPDLALGATAFPLYIGKMFVPINLRPSYDYPAFNILRVAAGAAVFLLVLWTAWKASQSKYRMIGLALSWFLIALLPFYQITPIRAFFAERFLYLPMVGLALAAGWNYAKWKAAKIPLFLWGLVLALITMTTIPTWRDEAHLWKNAIRQESTNAFAHACYANAVSHLTLKEKHLKLALLNRPSEGLRVACMINLAECYLRLKQPKKTIIWCQAALQIHPHNEEAIKRMGMATQILEGN